MNWYTIYTKPKKEEFVSDSLKEAGLTTYNPLLKQIKFIRGRYREVLSPLFPCYIFAKFEPEKHLWMIRYTRGVKKIVGGLNSPWQVSDDIINFIKSQEQDGIITLKPVNLKKGDRVKIAEGPFKDFIGIFEKELDGNERVVLLLSTIEYQANIIVDKSSLLRE